MRGSLQCYIWVVRDGIGMGWDGMVIKGHRSSKGTFGAKKGNLKPAFIILGGLRVGLPPDELLHIWKLLGGSPDLCVYRPLQHRSNRRLYTINPPYLEWPRCLATHPSTNYLKHNLPSMISSDLQEGPIVNW